MLSRLRLLIIEDVFLIALDIQRVLEEANAGQTVFARNFAEASTLADRFGEFDLAIVNPPDEADLEIADRLVAAGPAIVVCTAAQKDLSGTPLTGAPLVIKPFSDDDLLAACRRALEAGTKSPGW
jgi:two-component system, response regulator PdtaR